MSFDNPWVHNHACMQSIGVAVGCGWQTFVAYVNVACYYIVGVPLGSLLGFYFNLGAKVLLLLLYTKLFHYV